MKKIMYGALIGFICIIILLFTGTNTFGAPILTYVYSESMEPLIKVNDAFLVMPSSEYQIGDIIMFRPVVIEASYVTHRIIEVGEEGYITKGDNSPYKDQDNKEPEVTSDRIIGKVATFQGQPFIIPGLGYLTSFLQKELGSYTKYLSGVFLFLGILSAVVGKRKKIRKNKSRNRWRLRHVYRLITGIAVLIVIFSIFLGSRVSQIKYLVSEYPGTLGDQIELGKPGQLKMKVDNYGFIPVWTVAEGIAPIKVQTPPSYLWPRTTKPLSLEVTAHNNTGLYYGYVRIYNYPMLLPRALVVTLHHINPVLATTSCGLMTGFLVFILFRMLNLVHGFEDFIPLRAIKDKLASRRRKRIIAKMFGRRRSR